MEKYKRLGETGSYCPVTFQTTGLYVPGKTEISAVYKDKVRMITFLCWIWEQSNYIIIISFRVLTRKCAYIT